MTTKLSDLFSIELLDKMLVSKYVTKKDHPRAAISLYNYTERAQYDKVWNDVTRQCRGLIVRNDGTVLARPFRKFFNLSEVLHETDPKGPFNIFEKMDGSLGVLYWDGSRYAIATRGSFTSDQALWATEHLWQNYGGWCPNDNLTYLFEIIYPANRIVVNYGDQEDLVLLATVDTASGRTVPTPWWPGPEVPFHGLDFQPEKLQQLDRPNHEGFVLHYAVSDLRVKVKHEEYVRLHRILTNVSSKVIWEHLRDSKSLDEILDNVPDEFHAWVQATIRELTHQYDLLKQEIYRDYYLVKQALAGYHEPTRKDFALKAQQSKHRAALFSLADGKSLAPYIWKAVKPEYSRPFVGDKEEAA